MQEIFVMLYRDLQVIVDRQLLLANFFQASNRLLGTVLGVIVIAISGSIPFPSLRVSVVPR